MPTSYGADRPEHETENGNMVPGIGHAVLGTGHM